VDNKYKKADNLRHKGRFQSGGKACGEKSARKLRLPKADKYGKIKIAFRSKR
jgi:hypothetical protein